MAKNKKSFLDSYLPHYRPNLILALPIVLSQAGQMIVALADTLMVGQLGAVPLAAVSFANTIYIIGFVFAIGVAIAITPLIGKTHGSGRTHKVGYWLHHGAIANTIIALLLMSMLGLVSFLMPLMAQPEEVSKLAIPYFRLLVWSILPFCIFMVFKQFAEGIANTRVAMIITLGSNLINIVLNYILIYGKLGLPTLGVNGAGYATLISRILMPILFYIAFIKLPLFRKIKESISFWKIEWKAVWKIIKLGFPIGGQMVIEVSAFSLGGIMMGWMGKDALAAHQIVLTLASFTFMISLGLSSAATIKVSIFRGAKDFLNMKNSAYAVLQKVIIFMLFTGILFISLRHWIPALFVDDENVIVIASSLMIIAGLFQLFDGVQIVFIGALRGLEDVNTPTLITGIAYILICIPLSYLCAFTLHLGPKGIWIGYLSGLAVAGILLQRRFRFKCNQLQNPTENIES